jgi:hypothetical protein
VRISVSEGFEAGVARHLGKLAALPRAHDRPCGLQRFLSPHGARRILPCFRAPDRGR